MSNKLKKMSVVFAVMFAVVVIPAVSGGIAFAAEKTTYPLNYSGLSIESIQVEGNKLTLIGVPENNEYDYIWLQLRDSKSNKVFEDVVSRTDNKAVFTIPKSVDGEYALYLLKGIKRYDTYYVFWDFDSVHLNNGELIIPDTDVFKHNLSLASTDVLSEAAIEYYTMPTSDIQSDNPAIIQLANSITAGLTDDYEKTLAIHDWVCDEIYYDYDVHEERTYIDDYSALGTLNARRSVCEGYSNLMAALLRAEGIPARKVSGFAFGSYSQGYSPEMNDDGTIKTNHAWNEVYADGRWIIIDATWDSGNKYEYGQITADDGCKSHRYFDISTWLISWDHLLLKPGLYNEMILYIDYPMYYANGEWKQLTSDGATPMIVNGRTLLPIRPVIEEMGGTVSWVKEKGHIPRVKCKTNGFSAQMWEGIDYFYVNNEKYFFDVSPKVINGRTMIPLRALLEKMDCMVTWDANVDGFKGRITIGYAV